MHAGILYLVVLLYLRQIVLVWKRNALSIRVLDLLVFQSIFNPFYYKRHIGHRNVYNFLTGYNP